MALYVTNDLAFDVPGPGYEDLTTQDLQAPLHGGDRLALMIAREPLAPGSSLADAVSAHLTSEARRIPFHRVIERRDGMVAGRAAVEVVYRWAHGGRELHGREVHLVASGVRLTFSIIAPLDHRAACDAYFDRMISTFELEHRQEA